MKVFLIGYRCCGKTSAGKLLAEKTGFDFKDTDIYLQKMENKTVSEIVESKGWEFFRSLEEKYFAQIAADEKDAVVATGGGIVESRANREILKNKGTAVWLKAGIDTIIARINKDRNSKNLRPSLTDLSQKEEIESVLNKRDPQLERSLELIGTL